MIDMICGVSVVFVVLKPIICQAFQVEILKTKFRCGYVRQRIVEEAPYNNSAQLLLYFVTFLEVPQRLMGFYKKYLIIK